jgi:hypothetical protein
VRHQKLRNLEVARSALRRVRVIRVGGRVRVRVGVRARVWIRVRVTVRG